MFNKWILSLALAFFLAGSAAFAADKINLNTATAAQLESLNGVGASTATAIIDYRKTHGKFKSVKDLTMVKGIGEKKLSQLADHLMVAKKP